MHLKNTLVVFILRKPFFVAKYFTGLKIGRERLFLLFEIATHITKCIFNKILFLLELCEIPYYIIIETISN